MGNFLSKYSVGEIKTDKVIRSGKHTKVAHFDDLTGIKHRLTQKGFQKGFET